MSGLKKKRNTEKNERSEYAEARKEANKQNTQMYVYCEEVSDGKRQHLEGKVTGKYSAESPQAHCFMDYELAE